MKNKEQNNPLREEVLNIINSIQFRAWIILEEEEFEKLESRFEAMYKLPLELLFEDDVLMFLNKYADNAEKIKLKECKSAFIEKKDLGALV